MGTDSIRMFVDLWALGWTAVVVAGLVADLTPWPILKVLRGSGVAKWMILTSIAAVFGLTLAEAREASAVLAAWAIVMSSVKLLVDWLGEIF